MQVLNPSWIELRKIVFNMADLVYDGVVIGAGVFKPAGLLAIFVVHRMLLETFFVWRFSP